MRPLGQQVVCRLQFLGPFIHLLLQLLVKLLDFGVKLGIFQGDGRQVGGFLGVEGFTVPEPERADRTDQYTGPAADPSGTGVAVVGPDGKRPGVVAARIARAGWSGESLDGSRPRLADPRCARGAAC